MVQSYIESLRNDSQKRRKVLLATALAAVFIMAAVFWILRQGRHGAIFPPIMAIGKIPIVVFVVGVMRVFGRSYGRFS